MHDVARRKDVPMLVDVRRSRLHRCGVVDAVVFGKRHIAALEALARLLAVAVVAVGGEVESARGDPLRQRIVAERRPVGNVDKDGRDGLAVIVHDTG